MPNRIAGVVLHQYVDGNLITVRKPQSKIQVTIKTKGRMWSVSGQQLRKRRKARMPANDFHTSSASPLAKVVLSDGEQEAIMALITTVFSTKVGCGKTLTIPLF